MPRRRSSFGKKFFAFLLSGLIGYLLSVYHPIQPEATARVVGVHDGDTITVLSPTQEQIKVRLFGIDAPELQQAYGQQAKQALSRLVYGRSVSLVSHGKDRYKRTLAIVMVGSTNINLQLVREGYAWHYDQYSKDPVTEQAELYAKTRNLGLWQAPDQGPFSPRPPWEWRREKP